MTDDVKIHEELHKRYTQQLAQSMMQTKEALTMRILGGDNGGVPLFSEKSWEIEVNFDD